MLKKIFIYNFIVFDKVEIELSSGFNAISGESGAGKSLVFAAINFALGLGKKKETHKNPDRESIIILEFEISGNETISEFLKENDLYLDEEIVTIKRTLGKASENGSARAKSYINDIPVTSHIAEKLAGYLVQSLAYSDSSLCGSMPEIIALLDSHVLGNTPEELKEKYQQYQQIKNELAQAKQNANLADREKEYLEFAIKELKKASPKDGEEESLIVLKKTLASGKQISELVDKCTKLLNGSVIENLWLCHRNLAKLSELTGNIDFAQLEKEVESSAIVAEEAAKALQEKSFSGFGAENLEDIENRLYLLRSLARKYNTDIKSLPDQLASFSKKMQDLECSSDKIASLEKAIIKVKTEYGNLASALSVERQKIAQEFSLLVNGELSELNMADSQIFFKFTIRPDEVRLLGTDDVELSIIHCGREVGKLSNIASGGEKSRITLAFRIANCKRQSDKISPILLFDEVDTGVGGFVARKIGEKLRKLGESQQILSITHNAQVVSLANNHLLAIKSKVAGHSGQDIFSSEIKTLNYPERAREVARMISGLDITDEAIKQAEKLLII